MTVDKILAIAAAELGYHEGADNDSKYGAAYGLNHQPWCVMFLWWCFKQAGSDLFPNAAHCDGVRSFAKSIGRWIHAADIGVGEDIQRGDIIVWDYDYNGSGDHIGIVETVANNNRYTTIEGNYGDAVCRVNRTLEGVSGIYRPAYNINAGDDVINADDDAAAPMSGTISYGAVGYKVRVIQAVLMLNGFNLGTGGIDGEFGAYTENAVRQFQQRHGLESDGIVGELTLKAMWEGGN